MTDTTTATTTTNTMNDTTPATTTAARTIVDKADNAINADDVASHDDE